MSRQACSEMSLVVGGATVILSSHDFLAVYYVSATTISQHQLSVVSRCSSYPSAQHAHQETCSDKMRSGRRIETMQQSKSSLANCRSTHDATSRPTSILCRCLRINHIFNSFCPSLQHALIGRFGEHAMLQCDLSCRSAYPDGIMRHQNI
jgi:hypothetical protein